MARREAVAGIRHIGLAPRDDSPGIGLGMPLIHRLADEVEYRRPPGGGTEVWMRFNPEAGRGGSGDVREQRTHDAGVERGA